MNRYSLMKGGRTATLVLIAFGLASRILPAQTVKAEGLIKARSGATIILQTPDSAETVVLLTDHTKVGQIQGVLKARHKEMSMAALIPGLAIKVEGAYNELRQLVASSVKFKGNDLARAKSIQAGLHETKIQTQQNNEELEKQNAALQEQNEALKQQQEQLTAQQQKIAENKARIAAAISRFGQLDDYYILDEVSIYFGNGKTSLDPKYKPQLLEFAGKATKIEAFMVQIIGYASAVGSEELNQKLSEDRADNVANFLIQRGGIPLTNMMAPGAMGESRQVGNDRTEAGQAENRRVVVRVLQNKGISGMSDSGL